jgi:hypothetical protein
MIGIINSTTRLHCAVSCIDHGEAKEYGNYGKKLVALETLQFGCGGFNHFYNRLGHIIHFCMSSIPKYFVTNQSVFQINNLLTRQPDNVKMVLTDTEW